jgi:hypothetical protein
MKPLRSSARRRAFTLSQLLVLLALLALFLGFLFAAVSRVRDAAGRAQSQNNLKQIVLGTINCADTYNGKMPPGLSNWYPNAQLAEGSGYGPCLFHILPYLEQKPLYDSSATEIEKLKVYASWAIPGKSVKTYQSPEDPTSSPASDRSNYIANSLSLPLGGARYPAFYTDGTSNTIFYSEAYSEATDTISWKGQTETWTTARRWWDNPAWLPTPGPVMFQFAPPRNEASAWMPQGFSSSNMQVGLGDGSVRGLSPKLSTTTFYAACTPNGGEVLGADW